jgi:hypothetical protein
MITHRVVVVVVVVVVLGVWVLGCKKAQLDLHYGDRAYRQVNSQCRTLHA